MQSKKMKITQSIFRMNQKFCFLVVKVALKLDVAGFWYDVCPMLDGAEYFYVHQFEVVISCMEWAD